MNRTGLDTSALSRMLRRMAGEGSIEWVMEPIQASVLLDMADSLDENAKLLAERNYLLMNSNPTATELRRVRIAWKNDRDENTKLRELVREAIYARDDADWASIVSTAIELGIEVDR